MAKQRNIYIDYIKGILIILVICGHCIQFLEYKGSNAFYSDNFFKYIYIFHMPLLIAISGYYSYYSIRKLSLIQYIKSRIVYLFVPMTIWCIISSLILYIFLYFDLSAKEWLTILFQNIISAYWFIWTIIFSSIFSSILHKIKKDSIIVFIISAILFMLIDTKYLSLHLFKTCFPFFSIGYLLAKTDINKYIIFCKKYAILFIIATIICFVLWQHHMYMYNTPSSLIKWKLTLFRLIAGIVTSISFMVIFYYIYQKLIDSKVIILISNIGQETLGIYLSHSIIFTIIAKGLIQFNIPNTYSILYLIPSVIYAILFYYLSLLIRKNNMAAYLLLGKKIK